MRIAEIYHSLQGEGRLTGTPSVFVRTSGCNLRCRFCDTPYASWSPEGEYLSVEAVVAEVEKVSGTLRVPTSSGTRSVPDTLRHVVITGGEPMLFPDLVPLCAELRRRGMHVTIETAGTRFLPVECDLMCVSPKMSNSTPLASEAAGVDRDSRAKPRRDGHLAAVERGVRLPVQVRCWQYGGLRRGSDVPIWLARIRPGSNIAHAAGHRMLRVGGHRRMARALLPREWANLLPATAHRVVRMLSGDVGPVEAAYSRVEIRGRMPRLRILGSFLEYERKARRLVERRSIQVYIQSRPK